MKIWQDIFYTIMLRMKYMNFKIWYPAAQYEIISTIKYPYMIRINNSDSYYHIFQNLINLKMRDYIYKLPCY